MNIFTKVTNSKNQFICPQFFLTAYLAYVMNMFSAFQTFFSYEYILINTQNDIISINVRIVKIKIDNCIVITVISKSVDRQMDGHVRHTCFFFTQYRNLKLFFIFSSILNRQPGERLLLHLFFLFEFLLQLVSISLFFFFFTN